MTKPNKARALANNRYNRINTITVLLRFNKKTDQQLIEQLGRVSNKTGYIKQLIQADIKAHSYDVP